MPLTISVSVKPQAKKEGVTQLSASEFRVAVKAPPHEGKANLAVIKLLSEYFSVPQSRIKILRGHSAKKKVLVIG
jgi:uncharacterized protein (TIGR00251 family)